MLCLCVICVVFVWFCMAFAWYLCGFCVLTVWFLCVICVEFFVCYLRTSCLLICCSCAARSPRLLVSCSNSFTHPLSIPLRTTAPRGLSFLCHSGRARTGVSAPWLSSWTGGRTWPPRTTSSGPGYTGRATRPPPTRLGELSCVLSGGGGTPRQRAWLLSDDCRARCPPGGKIYNKTELER